MKLRKTQQEIIKEELLNGKKLTQKKVFFYFNIMRLTSIIYELKKQGMNILTEYRANLNGGRYAIYYMNIEKTT